MGNRPTPFLRTAVTQSSRPLLPGSSALLSTNQLCPGPGRAWPLPASSQAWRVGLPPSRAAPSWPLVMVRAPVRVSECGARSGKIVFAYLPSHLPAIRHGGSSISHFRILISSANSNIRGYRILSFHNLIIGHSWILGVFVFHSKSWGDGRPRLLPLGSQEVGCLEDTDTAGGSGPGPLRGTGS